MGIKRKDKEAMTETFDDTDCFQKGALVEVSLEDEGFRGSWFSATVLRSIARRRNKILLEFHTLMSENDQQVSKPLQEFVDVILVRPIPPRESKRCFSLNEEVDAFHNDGWWEGVITDICEGKEAGGKVRYSVFFRSSREQIEFEEEELRLHREWVHGKWLPALEEDGGEPEPPFSSVAQLPNAGDVSTLSS